MSPIIKQNFAQNSVANVYIALITIYFIIFFITNHIKLSALVCIASANFKDQLETN